MVHIIYVLGAPLACFFFAGRLGTHRFVPQGYTNAFGVFQTYYQDNQLRDYT